MKFLQNIFRVLTLIFIVSTGGNAIAGWNALGGGLTGGFVSPAGHVYGLGLNNGVLYAGGSFTIPVNGFAQWNGTGWTSVGGASPGAEVRAVTAGGGYV